MAEIRLPGSSFLGKAEGYVVVESDGESARRFVSDEDASAVFEQGFFEHPTHGAVQAAFDVRLVRRSNLD